MSLDDRRAFAAALWDLPPDDAVVLLASTESAHALVREAPPLDEVPDVVTPWIRARIWATAHRDAPVAPPLSLAALEEEIASASSRGLVLVDPATVTSFVASGVLARAFVFAPRGKKAKLRIDRVQTAFVRANGRRLVEDDGSDGGIVGAALAQLGGDAIAFKDLLRRARVSVRAGADDGKRLATALVRAWDTSDVELALPVQKPMK